MSVHAPTPVRFEVDGPNRTLTLTHPLLAAAWRWNERGRLDIVHITDTQTGRAWLSPDPREPIYLLGIADHGPRFHAFDQHCEVFAGSIGDVRLNEPGPRGTLQAALTINLHTPPSDPEPPVGRETVHFPSPLPPVTVTWTIEAHPDHATLRQWFTVTNIDTNAHTITRLPILQAELDGTSAGLTAHHGLDRRHRFRKEEGADWFTWNTQPLAPGDATTFKTGHRRNATWLALTHEAGDGLYVGWEANTETICSFGDLHGTGACGIDIWLEPEYVLAPGQALTSPAAFIGIAHGDLDELSYRTQRFVETVIARPVADERFPFVTFNSWGYGDQIDEDSMLRCFARCQELGIEHFVVDFGWEDAEWHPRKDLFPNGFKPLADAAHQAGMIFGVHLSFGNVSSLASVMQDHPEWANGIGQWAYLTEGNVLRFVLGNPSARDWMIDLLVRVVDETGIGHFLTDHFLWGNVDPATQPMTATNDYLTIAEGFDLVLEGLLQQRPHVMIEHCDNGLAFPTFKMVAQHVTAIGPDAVGSQYERVSTWRLSRVLPPRYLDHYVCERLAPQISFNEPFGDYEYRSQIFGGPMILMTDILALEPDSGDWNALVRTIDLFKRIRRKVAEGKVLHLLEPQPYERVGHGWDGWDAIGSWHEATDSAVILAFRLGGELDERVIPLHGLNPDSTYHVTFEDRPDTISRTGADLMHNGLPLTLPGPNQPRIVDGLGFVRASEVIHLTRTEPTA